jgi:hypothetical protein
VTYRVCTPKLAPSCSSVPNATKHQGSRNLKRSLIRQHKAQGGNENERSRAHSEGSIQPKDSGIRRQANHHG